MKLPALLLATLLPPALASCQPRHDAMDTTPAPHPAVPQGAEVATLGAGCFWCVEAVYRRLDGVLSATSGYMGGHVDHPTYQQVCGKNTGHAEVVQLVFDPRRISYRQILDWFWRLHDPTTPNRQGDDVGPQYRSVIFCPSDAQQADAHASREAAAANFDAPIVTAITPAATFWPAERYHQDFFAQNQSRNSYCRLVIAPKLNHLNLAPPPGGRGPEEGAE